MKRIKNLLVTILVTFMMLALTPGKIHADNPTIAEYPDAIPSDIFYQFEMDRTTYDAERSNIPTSLKVGNVGDTYTAYYPDALKYPDGTTKSIKIDVEYLGYNRYKAAGDQGAARYGRGIKLDSDKDILLHAMGMDYDVTYSFYEDSDFTTPAKIYGAIAFEDPDEGNYYFPANTRKLYYIDVEDVYGKHLKLSDYYTVSSEGIFHIMQDDTGWSTWPDFNYGTFGVLLENESSFNFKAEGKHDFLQILTRIIQIETSYKVEYYYETPTGYPSIPDYTSDTISVDMYETPVVSVTDSDKTPNPEKKGYALDEDKNTEWSKEVQPDGSTVLRVYFNQSYTIKYNKNADDATGEMEDNNYRISSETMPSEKDWTFTRPGYEFIGYKVENTGDIFTESQDFKADLLKEDDREIELYAQWKPLDYKIKYDKNAEDATGEMTDDDYTGADSKMPSKETWTFTRRGYKFIGYKVENEGEIFNGSNEYRPDLLVDEDRVITLYAQWEELPYTIKYDPNGGTGTMEDDEYKGSDETMPSKETWTFAKEGHDFIGFKLENKGELLNGSKEYRDTLLDDEDRVITLYAQWEPWKYTIKYDPNGGTGEMPDRIYHYDDPSMNSDPNKYTRRGYSFTGFLYTDEKGNQTLYKSINDFKNDLLRLGKNSEILLVAQWRKVPVQDVTPYVIPVTGVE